ncbi:amidase [Aminobacter aganoensis]|uniref:Indoleacetamide hydrolase n=1 Tax=Aminobacter aganoensis TaxID=83264 RepID=A0A7X0FCN4_9HYPH|nr:amidase [Aminobacter aganoensis]MBB6357251.1 Asp-tRNA(Asn)/Glu-tRNA(Gln) amidotransferase A subunit family amidase [Aminobacter aganoensis]
MVSFTAIVLDRLRKRDNRIDALANAVLEWWDDEALRQAALLDQKGSAGKQLAGVTIGVKANIDVAGVQTNAGSRVLLESPPAIHDAPIVGQLRQAGAILLAQTNMVEFAYGALGTNPTFGTPLSPLFPGENRVSGGSSSGAAVTVALGIVDAAIGTDTAGSVRIPAACCGTVGFKPTQGRYSEVGIIPLAPTLDTAGFLATDVATVSRLDAAATKTIYHGTAPPRIDELYFVVPRGFIEAIRCDAAILEIFDAAIEALRQAGAQIDERDMSYLLDPGVAARAGSVASVEAYSWHSALLARNVREYDPRVAPRIAAGADASASAYFSARRSLSVFADRYAGDVAEAAAILTPTIPTRPPRLEDLSDDDQYSAESSRIISLTEFANCINVPSLSLPLGKGTGAASILITGLHGKDIRLLETGRAVEALINKMAS